ncbi:MAG: KEOPS complex subunit Pcc1 [Thermoplasmata archaeon]
MIECELELRYEDEETAKLIGKSIEPDNEDYVKMDFVGSKLLLEVEGEDPLTLLQTLDDLLACITVAEEAEQVE